MSYLFKLYKHLLTKGGGGNNMDNNKYQEMLDTMSRLFGLRPVFYEEFNKIFPVYSNLSKLIEMEDENPAIVLARYGTPSEGFSTVSLFSTLTNLLLGRRIAFSTVKVITENNYERLLIVGVTEYKEGTQALTEIEKDNLNRLTKGYKLTIATDQNNIEGILNKVEICGYLGGV